jgi:hypothetical protein
MGVVAAEALGATAGREGAIATTKAGADTAAQQIASMLQDSSGGLVKFAQNITNNMAQNPNNAFAPQHYPELQNTTTLESRILTHALDVMKLKFSSGNRADAKPNLYEAPPGHTMQPQQNQNNVLEELRKILLEFLSGNFQTLGVSTPQRANTAGQYLSNSGGDPKTIAAVASVSESPTLNGMQKAMQGFKQGLEIFADQKFGLNATQRQDAALFKISSHNHSNGIGTESFNDATIATAVKGMGAKDQEQPLSARMSIISTVAKSLHAMPRPEPTPAPSKSEAEQHEQPYRSTNAFAPRPDM